MEPAATHYVGCGFGLLPISGHHTVTARHNLANGFAIARNVLAFGINHPDLDTGDGVTGTSLVLIALRAFPLHTELHARGCEHGCGFRETVAGVTKGAYLLFDFAHQGRRGRSSSDA